MTDTPRPAAQRIKEKKCRSSWNIDLQVLEIYGVVLGSNLGIYSGSFGNIQNYLTISGRFWDWRISQD
jgi:hypothetical protein